MMDCCESGLCTLGLVPFFPGFVKNNIVGFAHPR